ncbi:putative Peroxidase 48 [Elaeis guineensis]|uniref:Peroxidase n=1 Tax=Elaeis guineensis var. tenera TaxID=51953 RepID=A0A6J0PM18_ELAGV|nr:putative Peroxidase 48 [Elaeis guineensis]
MRWAAIAFAIFLVALSLVGPSGRSTQKKPKPSSSTTNASSILGLPKFLRFQEDGNEASSYSSTPPPAVALLEYDFYREKCPQAEEIVRSTMTQLYSKNAGVAPALLRLLFHDCFIRGCDASVLLDRINGSSSEKDAAPNHTLKGFDAVDDIKGRVEAACPATVSCADILVLATRDGLVLAGGPFYPVLTGRKDSERSFFGEAQLQIPAPDDNYTKTLANFASRGFTERETVSLLGAHSIGKLHCQFFRHRLYNFSGTGVPDGSMDLEMAAEMRAACSAGDGAAAAVGYQPEGRFGNHYYGRLLEGRGILHADQQLTAGRTVRWVRAYAAEGDSGLRAFRADFAHAMVKLSGLGPLSRSQGQVRTRCSRLV